MVVPESCSDHSNARTTMLYSHVISEEGQTVHPGAKSRERNRATWGGTLFATCIARSSIRLALSMGMQQN
jgi:hypothetical protein